MPDENDTPAPPSATLDRRGKPVAPLTPKQREWLESVSIRRPAPSFRYSPSVDERLAEFDEDTAAHDWALDKLEDGEGPRS